jgi:hypothetical protein
MRKSYRSKTRRRGGAATVFPLKYFDTHAPEPDAAAGRDLLKAIPPIGVRPRIGGHRKTRRILKKKTSGGFVPSIMDGFVAAASHYIVPIALFAGYKLMTRKGKKGSRRHTRRG